MTRSLKRSHLDFKILTFDWLRIRYVPLPPEEVRRARRAYRAAITGMDRKLGVLLQELDTLGIREEVAIVLHGYNPRSTPAAAAAAAKPKLD